MLVSYAATLTAIGALQIVALLVGPSVANTIYLIPCLRLESALLVPDGASSRRDGHDN